MKKTLIALAVLAASGASFAQVTITGAVKAGYASETNAYAQTTKTWTKENGGLGFDTSALTFAVTEQIESGLKAGASLSFDSLTRAGANGGDAALFLDGSLGKLTFSSGRGADYLSGGLSGVAGIGLDGKLFTILATDDAVSYALPAFGPVTVSIAHAESSIDQTLEGGATGGIVGIGAGGTGALGATTQANAGIYQRKDTVKVAYSAGALKAAVDYTSYDRQDASTSATYTGRVRASGAYDLGVAQIGLGFDSRNYVNGYTRIDSLVGINVPMGKMSLGAQFASRNKTAALVQTSAGVTAGYSLSPRTSLSYTFIRYDAAAGGNAGESSTYSGALLAHSF
jgi:predicted porin